MPNDIAVAIIISVPGTIAAAVSVYNLFNLRRLEKNTNSISERNEAIAKKLGIEEGKATEQRAQAARASR